MATFSPSGKRALDNCVSEAATAGHVPGFVLGVSNLDDEIYFKGAGTNVIGDSSTGEVNPDSVFWICSQTKMITALAALKLVEQGKLTFDTPVGDYLPEFKKPIIVERTSTQKTAFRPTNSVVTVMHLLNFSSGLFYPVVADDLLGLCEGYTSKEMHAAQDPMDAFFNVVKGTLPALPLKFEPGTDFVYGWSSDALGFIVEKLSGQTLEQFCKAHIFDPLDMKSSFYLTQAMRENTVNLTFREENGALRPWAEQIPIIEQDESKVHIHLGGVGLYSSMRDYLKLLQHIMAINAGRNVTNPILNADTIRTIFTPALPEKASESLSKFVMVEGTQWGTATALTTEDWPKRRKKGSAFWAGWAGTWHFMDPSTGIAVVFGVQVLPTQDIEVQKISSKLEALIYSALESGSVGL